MSALAESLRALGACSEAVSWAAEQPDLPTAWAACHRAGWLLWLAGRVAATPDERRLVVAAGCAVVRTVESQIPPEAMPALELAEAWARSEPITVTELSRAARAAEAAARAAWAAGAARAAWAAWAAEAAARAARAAEAAAWAAAAAAAGAAELERAADIVRARLVVELDGDTWRVRTVGGAS